MGERPLQLGTNETADLLPESDPLWRNVLDHTPLGMAVLDAASEYTLWVNQSFRNMLESAAHTSAVLSLSPRDYLPGLNISTWNERIRAIRQVRAPADPEEPIRAQFVHQGTRNICYWEWVVRPIIGAGGEGRLLLTVNEITDAIINERMLASAGRNAELARTRAEAVVRMTQRVNESSATAEVLRVITEEAAAFFEASHAATLLLTPDGRHFKIGHGMGVTLSDGAGVDSLAVEGTFAWSAIQKDRTLVLNVTADTPASTLLQAGGARPTAIVTSPIRHEDRVYGVVEVYIGSARDVTEDARILLSGFAGQAAIVLHKAELYEQLNEQKRQLHSIFENAPVGIIYIDSNLNVMAANPTSERIYGTPGESIEGKRYSDVLADIDPKVFSDALAGVPFHANQAVRRRSDGQELLCDVSVSPVKDESGRISEVLIISFDVSELVQARHAAENALDQARAAHSQMLEMEKMRAIGELASGVAHDFNNALMAILGYTELAEDSIDDPEAVEAHLKIVKKAALDASSTVQRLQRFARQRGIAKGEPTDINAIVQDVVQMTRPRWRDSAQKEGRSYQVNVDLQPVPPIQAEPSGLREVLINMIHNALNAMPEGGAMTLKTRQVQEDEIEISVTDTGHGMSPEVQSRVFDPFFTTRGVEGTGLGLAVSWTIIQRHGGSIRVTSREGEGSTFYIRLPIHPDHSRLVAPVAPPSGAVQIASNAKRILVVDDEPFIATVVSSILGRRGFVTTVCHSAQAAMEELERADPPFGLVITDHGMPGRNGLQLVADIKKRRPDLPVILLTGWGESLLQTYVAEAMPDAVLGKPINQKDLVDAVVAALAKRSSAKVHDAAPEQV